MRLNKYQRVWIERLMSGNSRKCKERLFGNYSSSNCCLGVAAKVCKQMGLCELDAEPGAINLDNVNHKIQDALNIHPEGEISQDRVNKKWVKFFKDNGIDYNSLVVLNDYSKMSHREIGRFINENREAVFYQC